MISVKISQLTSAMWETDSWLVVPTSANVYMMLSMMDCSSSVARSGHRSDTNDFPKLAVEAKYAPELFEYGFPQAHAQGYSELKCPAIPSLGYHLSRSRKPISPDVASASCRVEDNVSLDRLLACMTSDGEPRENCRRLASSDSMRLALRDIQRSSAACMRS